MSSIPGASINRILIIDDNQSIHEDIRKVLCGDDLAEASLSEVEILFPRKSPASISNQTFEIDSAYQGEEGVSKANRAMAENRPYVLALVDMRMPPGWDGLETIIQLWKLQPALQIVLCTAFADHSWEELTERLGQSDRLVILKKPFDGIELRQLAHALCGRKRTEDALVRSEAWHRVQFERAREAIIVCNPSHRIVRANPAAVELFGAQHENQLLSVCMTELSPERQPDGRLSRERILDIGPELERRGVCAFEWTHRRRDGTEFEAAVLLTSIEIDGQPLIHSSVRDISQSKATERALRDSEELYRTLISASPDAITVTDLNGSILFASDRGHDVFGDLALVDVSGRNLIEWVEPEQWEWAQNVMGRLKTDGCARNVECTLVRKDGGRFVAEINAAVLSSANGTPKGLIFVTRDITERKQAQVALQRSLSVFRATLQSTADGILVVDSSVHVSCYNERFVRLFHVPQELLAAGDDNPILLHVQSQMRDPEAFRARVCEIYSQPEADSFDLIELADERIVERYSCPQWVDVTV